MKKIGFIDLDTSHPRSFVKRINAMEGFVVAGLFDRGRVKGKEETDAFCGEFGVQPYESAEALAADMDGVMILSADWGTHFEDMKACLNAGTPCYADKPLTGSLDEADQFVALCKQTAVPVFGGSGWRWNEKIQAAYRETKNEKMENLLVSVPVERFFYGIHGVELLLGLLGPGIERVNVEREGDGFTVVSLFHKRGMLSRMVMNLPAYEVSRFNSFMINGELRSVFFDLDDIHNGLCGTFTKMVETGVSPTTPEELVESVKISFAIEESIQTGAEVAVDDLKIVREIDSADFMNSYGQLK